MIPMSKQQGFAGKAANAAFHAVAIRNIIKAFLQGGWAAAAMQVLRHYWPQVLAVALALILLPVIIICCFPMMMFGFDGSTDSQITEMSVQAKQVEGYFENYDQYCEQRTGEINTETANYRSSGYKVMQEGYYMPKNWFIALFSVSVGNDYSKVTELQVMDFMDNCITYEIYDDTTNNPNDSQHNEISKNTVLIKRMSSNEVMDKLNFSAMEREWATLLYNTLESEETDGNNSTYSN